MHSTVHTPVKPRTKSASISSKYHAVYHARYIHKHCDQKNLSYMGQLSQEILGIIISNQSVKYKTGIW